MGSCIIFGSEMVHYCHGEFDELNGNKVILLTASSILAELVMNDLARLAQQNKVFVDTPRSLRPDYQRCALTLA